MSAPGENTKAFLALIRHTEGTDPNIKGWDPYRVSYGYEFEIVDLAFHPSDPALGEARWRGKRLPDAMCRAVRLKPGCVSTAAGAYQFIWPTWRAFRDRLLLVNFEQPAQDDAAEAYLEELGALELIERGDIPEALKLASAAWASLPMSASGQPKVSLDRAIALFEEAGGNLA